MSKPKFFTAVFQIEDAAAFKTFAGQITAAMSDESLLHGAMVTAVGWEDSMTRAEGLVALCKEEGIDIPEELL